MKIIQITTDGSFNGRIFGLGEDGLVYIWVAEYEKWFLYDKENQHITSN
ncbi:MAG: hypothetical protein PHR33_03815 [Bacilli bacterium]|nr:hypothetical protein [Bacilli bacterium]